MTNKDKIEVGDIVTVGFSTEWSEWAIFEAEVLYSPSATGDSWRLRDCNGRLWYVQRFETMVLVSKGEDT